MKETDNAFVVAPFVRKYWTLSENYTSLVNCRFRWNLDRKNLIGIMMLWEDPIMTPSFSTKNNYTKIGVNIKPGLDYFLNKNWSIEATIGELGYNTSKEILMERRG
jgi:hypothetical protein